MKLHLTATSERGKPVTKSGNEYLRIEIRNDKRELTALITLDEYGIILLNKTTDKEFETLFNPKTEEEYIRRCACDCGCDYKLDGYAETEHVCGACLDNCKDAEKIEKEMNKPKTAREEHIEGCTGKICNGLCKCECHYI